MPPFAAWWRSLPIGDIGVQQGGQRLPESNGDDEEFDDIELDAVALSAIAGGARGEGGPC